jgi:ferredoxin-NADP reductase
MTGGLAAASKVLGQAGFLRIMAHVLRAKSLSPARVRPAEKQRTVLVAKTALTPSIWRLEFEVDEPVRFVGQYAKLRVAPFEWRDYSIAAASNKRLTFLISNRTHGDGSNYADAVQPGEATEIEVPLGSYHLQRNANRKVFVATGTGLAPFLPMFEQMVKAGELDAAELYFGCRTLAENITTAFTTVPRTVLCVSRGRAAPGGVQGRVTQAMAALEFDPQATDFYVCGSAAMVADCQIILERAGAPRILIEPY